MTATPEQKVLHVNCCRRKEDSQEFPFRGSDFHRVYMKPCHMGWKLPGVLIMQRRVPNSSYNDNRIINLTGALNPATTPGGNSLQV